MIDPGVCGTHRGWNLHRIAGIIFQKESRRGQTLSWWQQGGGEGAARRGEERVGERSGQAGWLAGSVVALVLIHNPCRPPSRRRRAATEVEKERERAMARGEGEGIVVNPPKHWRRASRRRHVRNYCRARYHRYMLGVWYITYDLPLSRGY